MRAYIDDCLAGTEGTAAQDFNMRWIGSLVAEAYRILDARRRVSLSGRRSARLSRGRACACLYEAHPMALIIEQAGGAASTGRRSNSRTRRRDAASARAADHGLGAQRPRRRAPFMRASKPTFDNTTRRCSARRGLFRAEGVPAACRASIPSSRSRALRAPARRRSSGPSSRYSAARSRCRLHRRRRLPPIQSRRNARDDGGGVQERQQAFQPFQPGDQSCSKSSKPCSATYGETGTGNDPRYYVHDDDEAKLHGARPGTFTDWSAVARRRRTCCFTRACTARS